MSSPDDYDDEDMATVGRGLMTAIETAAADRDGPLFGWHPSQCPSEVVGDLIRMVLEASAEQDAHAAISAAGYMIVPREPTPIMLQAAWRAFRGDRKGPLLDGAGPAFKEAIRAALAAKEHA